MVPTVWVALEFVRTFLLTGFPWQLLGYSQYRNLHLIQISDIFGVYGVSFLIALVNGALFLYVGRWWDTPIHYGKGRKRVVAIAGSVVAAAAILVWGYGYWQIRKVDRLTAQAPTKRIAVIQGNIDQSKFKQALEEINKYLAESPTDADIIRLRGDIHFENGEHGKAIADYSKAISINPNEGSYFNDRAMAYWVDQQWDKANADHFKAVQLEPDNAHFYANRGHSYYLQDHYQKALADAEKAIELGNHPEGHHVRGHALFELGKRDKAISSLSKAIELVASPENAFLHLCRANTLNSCKYYERAYRDFTKAVALEPENPSHCNALAWMLATCPDARFRDGKTAIALAGRAVKKSNSKSERAVYIDTLAAAYAENRNFQKAVRAQKTALSLMNKTNAVPKHIKEGMERLDYYEHMKAWRER